MSIVNGTSESATNGASSTTCTVTRPSAATEGRLLIADVYDDDAGGTVAAPDGTWNLEDSRTTDSNMHYYRWSKTMTSSEPASYTFTGFISRANDSYGRVVLTPWYDDADANATMGVSGTGFDIQPSGGPANPTHTSVDNCVLVMSTGCDYYFSVTTAPTGMSLTFSFTGNGTGDGSSSVNNYSETITTGGAESKTVEYNNDEVVGALYHITATASSGGSIDDINTDEVIDNAETGNTITYSGFTNQSGTFTLALRATADTSATTTCTSVSLAAGTGTFDSPDVKDYGETATVGAPLTSTNNIVEAFLTETDAAPDETATITVTRGAETGYAIVEVLSASKAEGSILEGVTGTIVDESIIYGPTANNTSVTAAGVITTDQTTGTIDFWLWKKDAGTWEKIIFSLSSSAGGASTGSGFITSVVKSTVNPIVRGI